jgi:hypothetical protein
MKDEFNALLPQRQPGYLADALGARVEQYYALEKDVPLSGAWGMERRASGRNNWRRRLPVARFF